MFCKISQPNFCQNFCCKRNSAHSWLGLPCTIFQIPLDRDFKPEEKEVEGDINGDGRWARSTLQKTNLRSGACDLSPELRGSSSSSFEKSEKKAKAPPRCCYLLANYFSNIFLNQFSRAGSSPNVLSFGPIQVVLIELGLPSGFLTLGLHISSLHFVLSFFHQGF